jgi:hypothetical protein
MQTSKAALRECCVRARKMGRTPFNDYQMENINRLTNAIWWILDLYNANLVWDGYKEFMAGRVYTSDADELAMNYLKRFNKVV